MEKQKSFAQGTLERLQSLRTKSFSLGKMEKQKGLMQQGSVEKKLKDSAGKKGDTELHLAVRAGNLSSVRNTVCDVDDEVQLKELMCKQNQDGETALYVACEIGILGTVKVLLKVVDVQLASIKARNSYDSFHIATKQGHFDIVKELYQSFPALAMTTNSSNSTALDTAATQGHLNIVNFLLDTGDDLAKIARNNGKTVLHSAARMGHVEVVKVIIKKDPIIGFRIDKKGQTAFHMAVKGNNVDIVRELIKPDMSIVKVEDGKGNTALHVAIRKRRPETSVVVVEQKAKKVMVFVMNKLMWLACICISISFVSLTYIVVGKHDLWLAWCTMAIGASAMVSTIGSMCYCIVVHRIEVKNLKSVKKASRSESFNLSAGSDREMLIIDTEFKKKMYAL